MAKNGKKERGPAYTIAFCSLMAALGAAMMTTGGMIPVMTREFDSKTARKTRKGAWRLYFFVKGEKKHLHNVA